MLPRALPLALLLMLTISAATKACTCAQAPPGKCPGLQKDEVVFLGTVTESVSFAPASSSPASAGQPPVASAKDDQPAAPITRYRFRVDERFAGADAPEIDIFSGGEDGDCGYRFKKGEQYVVFTNQGTDGHLFATICSGTRLASDARALLPQLRAMRMGGRIASVFGVLRRADPPFLALPRDPRADPPGESLANPDTPLGGVSLHLRSRDDRFETSTDTYGVYSFYDVHAGEYRFTAHLPARMELTQKTLSGGLPPFKIPNGACYEYNVDALPTGHIRGSVLGPDGKPLMLASVELYRAGGYADTRPGQWGFQGATGVFDIDHIGPGEYILVYNRTNRLDPDSPFPRAFYPGVAVASDAQPIKLKDGQQLLNVNMKLSGGYPTRQLHVRLKWQDGRPPGSVTVMAKADQGDNPAAQKIGEALYQFTLLESTNYTISAWEDLTPQRASRHRNAHCAVPARIETPPVAVSGSDPATKEVTLDFSTPACLEQ
jgi:hypothetical protein